MTPDRSPEGRHALVITRVQIDRMDGIARPFALEGLSPGITIVHGPNASGKSRTAHALQCLLWPGAIDRFARIEGDLALADDAWRVRVDDHGVVPYRGGQPAPKPLADLDPLLRDRYLLTLPDLLRSQDPGFAKLIQRESAGGYDLPGARRSLDDTGAPPTGRASRLARELNDARSQRAARRAADAALRAQETALDERRRQRDAAIVAEQEVALLDAAIEHRRAVEALARLEAERVAFGPVIGRMAGDEPTRLIDLERDLAEQRALRAQTERAVADAERRLLDAGFADVLPDATAVATLDAVMQRLGRLESERHHETQQLADHTAALAERQRQLAADLTDIQMADLDHDGLRQLAGLLAEEVQAGHTLDAARELHAWIGTVETPPHLLASRRAVDLLADWRRAAAISPEATAGPLPVWALLGGAAVIVLQAVWLTVVVAPWAGVLVLFAVPLVVAALRLQSAAGTGDTAAIEGQFAALGLAGPDRWAPEAVDAASARLTADLVAAEIDQEKATRWAALADRRRDADARAREVAARREALIDTLGVVPPPATSPDGLRVVSAALERWRDARETSARSTARLEQIACDTESALADISAMLDHPVADAETAGAVVQVFRQRLATARDARRDAEEHRRTLVGQIGPHIATQEAAIARVFTDLDLEPGDDLRLRDLSERLPAWRDHCRHVDEQRGTVAALAKPLDVRPDLRDLAVPDLERRRDDASGVAGQREALAAGIVETETRIGEAKQGTALEDAVAAEQAALDALRADRDLILARTALWRLGSFIQQRSRDASRPPVFRAAQELFAAFTAGAFRLEVRDADEPTFGAVDTRTGDELTLDQLSSGTRVQLLIAVRLAFIERMETGPRLPLILDEAFANTDDARADAIMRATIEIGRSGRQVIYLTSRHDEVAQWRHHIDEAGGVPSAAIDLGAVRGLAAASVPNRLTWQPPNRERMVIPVEATPDEVRRLLGVPPIDPWADDVHGVDLWYIVPDPAAVVELRHMGVATWGQYTTLRESDPQRSIARFGAVEARVHALVDVLQAALTAYRRGRGRPVTPEVLAASRAISARFERRVMDLALEGERDGERLIRALREQRVPWFRAQNIDELETYLKDHGHIVLVGILSASEIRAAAALAATDASGSPIVTDEEIDALLARVFREAD